MIYTDWFLKQGYSHKICQDYTYVGDDFIILSDGCSSSPFTDVGSRLLCFAAASLLNGQKNNVPSRSMFGHQVISIAYASAKNLGLPLQSLDATLMVAFKKDDDIMVYTYGDGCIIYEPKSGLPSMHYMIEYNNNAPEYLTYWIDNKRFLQYKQEFGGEVEMCLSSNEWDDIIEYQGLIAFSSSTLSCITLMSDGITSFTKKENREVNSFSSTNAIDKLTSILPGKGEYVKRRSNIAFRYFDKFFIDHYDDLSIVGLHNKEE